ncbi:MAG TPA: PD-(D/E)XK nuclease family protein [Edaphobacter sp.]|nr:PD-(D/E)XK nuclease family protein [Edaphobacter sp.]
MDGVELLPVEIVDALERGATVVTGNQRAARSLRRGFDQRNKERGLASWAPPKVMAWDGWMAALWQGLLIEGRATQMLLNRTQEHVVWRTILEADEELASLRTVESLAEIAADAWRLVCRFEGQRRLRGADGSADTRAFLRWARTFERLCQAERFLAQSQLEEALRSALDNGLVGLPVGGVVLVGFDGMTPAQAKLVEALRSAGVEVEELRPAVEAARRMLMEADDEQEELRVAARWVRKFLEEQPGAKVAVIVPGLETERREIDRVFREVLAPELEDIRAGNEVGPYEFSLGVTLAETPMVATALNLLRWAVAALPLERVSGLLLSRYFALTSEERGVRAEFDAFELRKARMLRPEISLEGLFDAVSGSKRKGKLSRLSGALRAMRVVANRLQGMTARAHAEWAEGMRELLEVAGWGSAAGETSVEFQTRRKWESALDELATLDFDGVQVEFAQALEGLERIARQTTFAPESRDAPVQVMGPLEAAGGRFDAVWFLRAGDLSWPAAANASPLLPWAMQRELGMPGVDAARDAEQARRVTERVAASAGTVVFSYAKESAEGRQRASQVLEGLALEEIAAAELLAPESARVIVDLEEVADDVAVATLPDRVIRGGAAVLQSQAACGFRAFAEHRLGSTELESVELGMDALESGIVVHSVMEIFWGQVKTQDALREMTLFEREEVLDVAIGEGLRKIAQLSSSEWDDAYVTMQRERLRRLLRPWLEHELARPKFSVKQREEKASDVQIGPLHLNLRIDRVDETEGGELVIDYKTGRVSTSDWLSERPDAPQLPLYAVVSDAARLGGVAFARLRVGKEMGWKGFVAGDGVLLKPDRLKTESFATQVEEWREVLTKLAEQFAAGEAGVRPKSYPKTCAYCGQRLLCRVVGENLEETEDEGEMGDSPGVSGG